MEGDGTDCIVFNATLLDLQLSDLQATVLSKTTDISLTVQFSVQSAIASIAPSFKKQLLLLVQSSRATENEHRPSFAKVCLLLPVWSGARRAFRALSDEGTTNQYRLSFATLSSCCPPLRSALDPFEVLSPLASRCRLQRA